MDVVDVAVNEVGPAGVEATELLGDSSSGAAEVRPGFQEDVHDERP
jgi:hypothetical protein